MAMMGAFIAYAIANAFDIPGCGGGADRHGPVGDRRRRHRTGADPAVRPVQPPRHRHRHAVAVPDPQRHRRRHLGVRRTGVPVAVPRPQRDVRAPRRRRSSTPTCSPGSPSWSRCSSSPCCCNKTKIGLAFRAVSSSLESSQLLGIHIGRTLQFGWALAAAMGTLAGSLVARTTLLEPNFMGRVLIYSFAAATLGGLDSLGGAVVAGIIIGLVQTMGGGYVDAIGSELAPAVALVRHRHRPDRSDRAACSAPSGSSASDGLDHAPPGLGRSPGLRHRSPG